MKQTKKQYFLAFFLFMLFLCGYVFFISFWSIHKSEVFHAQLIDSTIYEQEKQFLKNTVKNTISDITRARIHYIEESTQEIGKVLEYISNSYETQSQSFDFYIKNIFVSRLNDESFFIQIENTKNKEIIFSNISNPLLLTDTCIIGTYSVSTGINYDWVYSETKKVIKTIIHQQEFEDESYIWVNEILNWDGGDNYAVRLIHPSLIDTEGMLLSTNLTDLRGSLPYLEELEGVREHGEIYNRYYFKRKNSNSIEEKLTYATLFKEFNWIVAMGSYVKDIDGYASQIHLDSAEINRQIFLFLSFSIVFFLVIGFIIVFYFGNRFILETKLQIKEEANTDPLTGVFNRRLAEKYLIKARKNFKIQKESPLICMIDIDNFKQINDTYGHDIGDLVLCSTIRAIQNTMRLSDELFRWGGEEFLLVYNGVHQKDAYNLGLRLNREIAESTIDVIHDEKNITISVTASIGIAWFFTKDSDSKSVVRRADLALYDAKKGGKNCSRMYKA